MGSVITPVSVRIELNQRKPSCCPQRTGELFGVENPTRLVSKVLVCDCECCRGEPELIFSFYAWRRVHKSHSDLRDGPGQAALGKSWVWAGWGWGCPKAGGTGTKSQRTQNPGIQSPVIEN